jgi:membrane fusion protein (multidrug efflux system)
MLGSLSKKNFFILVSIVVVGVIAYRAANKTTQWTDSASLTTDISTMSFKLSGFIKTIAVDDNQLVHQGDLLATLDDADYQIAYDQAQAALLVTESEVEAAQRSYNILTITAPASLAAAQAQVKAAQAQLDNTEKNLKRAQYLTNVTTQQDLDKLVAQQLIDFNNYQESLAALQKANTVQEQLDLAKAQLKGFDGHVKKAKTLVAEAAKNLENTKIKSPFDGRVTQKSITLGEYVLPGQRIMAIVNNKPWVLANYKETQLTRIKPGQHAVITIDAYPNMSFDCTVDSIQRGTGAAYSLFPPENATGNFVKVVQRVPVKITLNDPIPQHLILGPGMSVLATVHTHE